jgi:hypothetical protein
MLNLDCWSWSPGPRYWCGGDTDVANLGCWNCLPTLASLGVPQVLPRILRPGIHKFPVQDSRLQCQPQRYVSSLTIPPWARLNRATSFGACSLHATRHDLLVRLRGFFFVLFEMFLWRWRVPPKRPNRSGCSSRPKCSRTNSHPIGRQKGAGFQNELGWLVDAQRTFEMTNFEPPFFPSLGG